MAKKTAAVTFLFFWLWGLGASTAAAGTFTIIELPLTNNDLVGYGRIPVQVAAYEFPPYYSSRLPEHFLGSLISELNSMQNEYLFIIREVRPQDRYSALGAKMPITTQHSSAATYQCCDVMFFEATTWGWPDNGSIYASEPLIYGADRLYSRNPEYVPPGHDDLVGGVVGYHYQYVGFAPDSHGHNGDFQLYRADSQLTLLNMLRNQRLQYALFTDEFIHWLAVEQPELTADLYPAPFVDGEYATQVLVSERSSISFAELMEFVYYLLEQPSVVAAMERYNLQPTSAVKPE